MRFLKLFIGKCVVNGQDGHFPPPEKDHRMAHPSFFSRVVVPLLGGLLLILTVEFVIYAYKPLSISTNNQIGDLMLIESPIVQFRKHYIVLNEPEEKKGESRNISVFAGEY